MAKLAIILTGLWLFQGPSLEDATVVFGITHMGVLTVEGEFDKITADIERNSANGWTIKGEIDVISIDTGDESRDETLMTKQYLNVAAYPTIPFEARLLAVGEQIQIAINLEIRGIQTQLAGELHEEDGKLASNPMTLDRKEIGLDFGLMDSLIGDEITIVINSGIRLSELY